VPVVLLLLVLMGWWMRAALERSVKASKREELRAILNANVSALEVWFENQRSLVAALAELRAYLTPTCREHGYEGFVIVAPDGTIIGTHADAGALGSRIAAERFGILARVLGGETMVSQPFVPDVAIPDASGAVREDQPIMVVAGPVRDDGGRVAALLSLVIDPDRDFTRMLQTGRVESSGETYAFSAEGLLLSHSRFDDQLRENRPIVPQLERAILSCLEKDRERRPRGARELGDELDRCAAAAAAWTDELARQWWERHLKRTPADDAGRPTGQPTGTVVVDRRGQI